MDSKGGTLSQERFEEQSSPQSRGAGCGAVSRSSVLGYLALYLTTGGALCLRCDCIAFMQYSEH